MVFVYGIELLHYLFIYFFFDKELLHYYYTMKYVYKEP